MHACTIINRCLHVKIQWQASINISCILDLVSQPDVLCGGGEENVWSLSHTFCDSLECNYITSHPSTFADNMACLLCLSVLRCDQRRRVSTTSLRPVCEELLKLCHENCVVSEAFTRPDAFFCRPCVRRVEAVVRLGKELVEKKGILENQLQMLAERCLVYCCSYA